jgi:hypothetical protein
MEGFCGEAGGKVILRVLPANDLRHPIFTRSTPLIGVSRSAEFVDTAAEIPPPAWRHLRDSSRA